MSMVAPKTLTIQSSMVSTGKLTRRLEQSKTTQSMETHFSSISLMITATRTIAMNQKCRWSTLKVTKMLWKTSKTMRMKQIGFLTNRQKLATSVSRSSTFFSAVITAKFAVKSFARTAQPLPICASMVRSKNFAAAKSAQIKAKS